MGPKASAGKKKPAEKQPPVDEKLGSVEVTTNNIKTVLLLISSPELGIVCKACEAVLSYMQKSDVHIMEVMELGGVDRFFPLLSSQDRAARCHGILCINCMIQQAPIRSVLFKTEGFLAAVLKLLQPDEELHTVERATTALSQLANDYSFKVALGRHAAHKPLLPLLQSPDPDVQRNSVKTLCLLLEDFHLRDSFLEEGGLPMLVNLLTSEYAAIQELALSTLRSCMHHGPCREALAGGEELGKVVAFLGNKKSSDLHVLGVEVLGLCLQAADSMTLLHTSGCLQLLLAHITDSADPNMKRNATLALARAATDALSRKLLHESQCEKTFIQFLASEDPGVLEAACTMLGNMAALSSSQQRIGVEGGVADLVQHFVREEDSLRVSLVLCLSRLLQDCPSNCRYLADSAGGLEALVGILADRLATCRQLAAECVKSVCCDESIRQRLLVGGVILPLLGCVSFQDSAVQASAVRALGMLATDMAARQQVCVSGGTEALLKLLQSSSREVVKNALWTLTVCAQNTQIAEEMGKLGGIEKLQLIASSEDKLCSSLAQNCQNKLMDFNLAAKYWVAGCLDYTDIIVNMEFYDPGPALSRQPFKSLSELAKTPFSVNQPILVVNVMSKSIPAPEEQVPLETSSTRVSSPSNSQRGKSRLQGTRSKRSKADRDVESRTSEENELSKSDSKTGLPTSVAILEPDKGLMSHCKHVQTSIKSLSTSTQQVQELARYVVSQLGGAVERSSSLSYELSAAHLQTARQSNFIALGELQQGSFQHRALLFKVLCDSLGVGCSLVRGSYGRHWNEVCVREEETEADSSSGGHAVYLVDLMYEPGTLYQQHSSQATQYKHI